MAGFFREVVVGADETLLPGNTRPPGFKSTGPRPGGPYTFDWWVVFVDADGAPLEGGSATVQWYAVDVGDVQVTTPTLGQAVTTDALTTVTKGVGEKLWPWAVVTSMAPPVDAARLRIVMVASALQQTDGGADATAAAVIALLDDGSGVLSRIKASAASAVHDEDIASDVVQALTNNGLTISGIQTVVETAISDGTVQPDAAVQRVSGVFSGADTELKVMFGFTGFAYRIYGVLISCSVAPSDVTICGGEPLSSLPITLTYKLAVGGVLPTGRNEFVTQFDTAPNEAVVLRKTAGATLTYDIDFNYISTP